MDLLCKKHESGAELTRRAFWISQLVLPFLPSCLLYCNLSIKMCIDFVQEVRTALPIWTLPYSNGLTFNEAHYGESGMPRFRSV